MFGIGTGELLMLLVLALIVLGPERMPQLARDIGRTLGDLRRTSDELRGEFLDADKVIDLAARQGTPAPAELPAPPATPADVGATEPASEPSARPDAAVPDEHATQAEVVSTGDETDFDREARLAREKLDDPDAVERAKREGWPVPTDEAGTNPDRWS
jgi:sec-independent protein translocase protein TatB